jgi:hypothetical protein
VVDGAGEERGVRLESSVIRLDAVGWDRAAAKRPRFNRSTLTSFLISLVRYPCLGNRQIRWPPRAATVEASSSYRW